MELSSSGLGSCGERRLGRTIFRTSIRRAMGGSFRKTVFRSALASTNRFGLSRQAKSAAIGLGKRLRLLLQADGSCDRLIPHEYAIELHGVGQCLSPWTVGSWPDAGRPNDIRIPLWPMGDALRLIRRLDTPFDGESLQVGRRNRRRVRPPVACRHRKLLPICITDRAVIQRAGRDGASAHRDDADDKVLRRLDHAPWMFSNYQRR